MTLFIEPPESAGTLLGIAFENVRNRRSAFRWLVSTFPPATGWGNVGLRIVPSGAWTVMGAKAPWNIFWPYFLTSSRTLLSPVMLAAVWALRSPILSSGVRDLDTRAFTALLMNLFFRMRYLGSITTPSSNRVSASIEILPGTFPPTSAWCALLAAYAMSLFA